MSIVLISGSGFYDFQGSLENAQHQTIATPSGEVSVQQGQLANQNVSFMARHGSGHRDLSHQINHLAHLSACQALGAEAIIGMSIVGVVNPDLPLGELMLPHDLYYPDNRLPSGAVCSLFEQPGAPGRGHLIMGQHFNQGLIKQLKTAASQESLIVHSELNYAYVQGPRFNSRSEIRALAQHQIDLVSQTLGPEAVLAGELEIPYLGLCFGVDYANGVQAEPTPITVLTENMQTSKERFTQVLTRLLADWQRPAFAGFVYRFD